MASSSVRLTDGSFSFETGVDSSRVSTVQSEITPHGLPRTAVAWGSNATFRGGAISPRRGWNHLIANVDARVKEDYGIVDPLYQGGWLYVPAFSSNPYLVLSISGHIYKVLVEAPYTIIELGNTGPFTATNPEFNPPDELHANFCQAEEFLIIQAGDLVTLPLFWDGVTLRRSVGIISANNVPGTAPLGQLPYNELPAATAMCYYMNRLWYAQERQYCAGDITASRGSGSAPYNYRDSVLKVTENPLAIGGDGFIVPTNAGTIRALASTASLDAALGQGNLYIFTQKSIYKLVVPITRLDWINADSNNQPLQSVAQQTNGSVNDRSIVAVNGDLFYRSLEPSVRSLALSVRNFGQWGNTPISNNEERIFQFENRALLRATSGINFENRLYETCLPIQTSGGVVSQGIIPLDFDLISTLQTKLPPAWEGILEGLLHYQLFQGVFGGLERAFSVSRSEVDGSMQVWELTANDKWDNQNDNDKCSTDPQVNKRVEFSFETPSFTFGKEFELKRLDGAELFFDKVFGTVDVLVEYRPDAEACWNLWHATKFCVEKNTCEDVTNPTAYPVPITDNRQGYKSPLVLPKPPLPKCGGMQTRPVDIGYSFQARVTIKGFCRVRGLLLFAIPVDKSSFSGLSC